MMKASITGREKTGFILIALVGFVTLVACFVVDRIPQDAAYHNFSDIQSLFGLPNFQNVVSNLPFLIVGLLGLKSFMLTTKGEENAGQGVENRLKDGPGRSGLNVVRSNFLAYKILYFGTALVGVGSSYYHLNPNNETLVWDRLPMTIAFMALFSIIISEFISELRGRQLLFPLLAVGLSSVLYWWYTERQGNGDLRPYAVVQFFPMLVIPLILLFFRSRYTAVSCYWWLITTYFLAKVFEYFDVQIHQTLGAVSGHAIKHVFPAIGLYLLLRGYKARL